jgi:hypothetical protein
MKELELVVLTRDMPEHRLRAGDVGTVVHSYRAGAYEVEFVSAGGETLAVLTVTEDDVRAMDQREILHVRSLASR